MNDTIVGLIWVCQCCLLSHANGECCADDLHGGDGIEPLSNIGDGYDVTMGMLDEEHADGCTREVRDVNGCDCEVNTFSTSRCDGCGSFLHGERHAMTLWKRTTTRTLIHAVDPFTTGRARCGAKSESLMSLAYFMDCYDNPSPVRRVCRKCYRAILGF